MSSEKVVSRLSGQVQPAVIIIKPYRSLVVLCVVSRLSQGHTGYVYSVAFGPGDLLASGSEDKTIKLWNTLAQCKYTIQEEGHADWVSCVRFSPNNSNPIIVSCGWDKYVKVKSL